MLKLIHFTENLGNVNNIKQRDCKLVINERTFSSGEPGVFISVYSQLVFLAQCDYSQSLNIFGKDFTFLKVNLIHLKTNLFDF